MSSHKKGDAVNETALFHAALPRHGVKRLAQLACVPVETARHWMYRHFSTARQREIAHQLLAEMDRQDREERAAARRWLREKAGINAVTAPGDATESAVGGPLAADMASAGAGVAADMAGPAPPLRRRLARRLAEFAER